MKRTGACLCGAIKFEVKDTPSKVGACHCDMCRTWSGGVYLALHLTKDQISFSGEDSIERFTSSDWAERAFCKSCGTSLFYRVTAPGPNEGEIHLAFGTLDDQSDMHLQEEIFIDRKPEGYSFAQDTAKMTADEMFALFADAGDAEA